MSVLDENVYEGGQFCSGLYFGSYGAKTLTEIADKAVVLMDRHNPLHHIPFLNNNNKTKSENNTAQEESEPEEEKIKIFDI